MDFQDAVQDLLAQANLGHAHQAEVRVCHAEQLPEFDTVLLEERDEVAELLTQQKHLQVSHRRAVG